MDNDLTLLVGSRRIANGRVQSVTLQPIVGAYELIFPLYLSVLPGEGGLPSASIAGARIVAEPSQGEPKPLGYARAEQPSDILCQPHAHTATPSLHLYLHPGQVSALETLRDAGDLTFRLAMSGTAMDHQGPQHLHGDCTVAVPRSRWLQTLRNAQARNVMLFEVPLPGPGGEASNHPASTIQQAEERYRNGDYIGCIASCRTTIEETGRRIYAETDWATPAIERLASDRKAMTEPERRAALYAILRHYTHQAHHGPSEGGESAYTRNDARFVLTLTATALAHALPH